MTAERSSPVQEQIATEGGPRVLIAASGTGGHLFPALYIARAVQRLNPGAVIQFVGSGRPLEERIIDRNGFRREVLTVSGVKSLGVGGLVRFLGGLPRGLLQTIRFIRKFRPDIVVGAGGYVSVLPVLIAWCAGIPTWIHEAELRPGLANWFLSLFARRTSTAFEGAKLPFWARTIYTGHPVRESLQRWERKAPRIPPQRLLILGGSQGARALDEAACAIAKVAQQFGLEVWHQTREENRGAVEAAYRQEQVTARVVSFIDEMAEAYQWCDLLICRAGAGTVMELGIVGKPAILVPYPFAQGDHQRKNAETLQRLGKVHIVTESAGFIAALAGTLSSLCHPVRYQELYDAPSPSRSASAADEIARGVITLIEAKRG